jgi:hypothetical protein
MAMASVAGDAAECSPGVVAVVDGFNLVGALRGAVEVVVTGQLDRLMQLAELPTVDIAVLPVGARVATPWHNFVIHNVEPSDDASRLGENRTRIRRRWGFRPATVQEELRWVAWRPTSAGGQPP